MRISAEAALGRFCWDSSVLSPSKGKHKRWTNALFGLVVLQCGSLGTATKTETWVFLLCALHVVVENGTFLPLLTPLWSVSTSHSLFCCTQMYINCEQREFRDWKAHLICSLRLFRGKKFLKCYFCSCVGHKQLFSKVCVTRCFLLAENFGLRLTSSEKRASDWLLCFCASWRHWVRCDVIMCVVTSWSLSGLRSHLLHTSRSSLTLHTKNFSTNKQLCNGLGGGVTLHVHSSKICCQRIVPKGRMLAQKLIFFFFSMDHCPHPCWFWVPNTFDQIDQRIRSLDQQQTHEVWSHCDVDFVWQVGRLCSAIAVTVTANIGQK